MNKMAKAFVAFAFAMLVIASLKLVFPDFMGIIETKMICLLMDSCSTDIGLPAGVFGE